MNLVKARFKILPILSAIFVTAIFLTPTAATQAVFNSPAPASQVLHTSSVAPVVNMLPTTFNPNLVGGSPFCLSGSLGTIICYPPNFLKTAYNFPSTFGRWGITGKGSTIVIVDAFGSPTIQSDLNTYDSAFGVPATTVTILCGPSWTGAVTDVCPLNTIGDITTVGNSPGGLACGGVGGVTGWAEETTLDVTMAHSLAPGAHIVLLVANDCYDSSLYGAEHAVVSQWKYRGSVMSQSFGEPDDLAACTALDPTNSYCVSYDPTLLNFPNSVFQQAKAMHWTVIASTGDQGANEDAEVLGTLELTPSFPATSPLVLAAGGTQGSPYGGVYGGPPGPGINFTCTAWTICDTGLVNINGGPFGCGTAVRPGEPTSCFPWSYGGESTWNEALTFYSVGYSSGGGMSINYGIPSYQRSLARHNVTTMLGASIQPYGRMTPDVSFNSAVYGGVMAYLGFIGRWAVFGGTSAASPAWAGIIALVNQANGGPVGYINPDIYAIGHSRAFHDVTQGNNADCSGLCGEDGFVAGKGYDLTTGWGTPDVSRLIQALSN